MLFPQELIIQILVWLPVKSLIRFKCVCKSWFSLISHDTHFAISHFQLTSTTTPNHRILLISFLPLETLSINFEPLLEDYNASVSLDLGCILGDIVIGAIEIKGSCRGFILLCRSHMESIYIWNPSTGVHKQIPLSPFGGSKLDVAYYYGFGYDHSTDDYLVVLMSRHYSDDAPLHLEYFSLKANTWKQVETPHIPYVHRSFYIKGGCLYNGAIHWLALRDDLQLDVIVAFDLMEKKLSYMLLPRDSDGSSTLFYGLWIYEECLSAYTMNYANNTADIFVMKEYKVSSSWTMTLALPIDVIPNEKFFPLCCTKSGDIVGTDGGSGLVKYDKNGQFLEHHYYSDKDRCEVTTYIESLLSLPSGGDNQQA